MDLMAKGQEWFADKMQATLSREVTYRGIRDGVGVVSPLTVGLGTSQLAPINTLGIEPGITDMTLQHPLAFDRDYIVRAKNLIDAGLWPPLGGDLVDDTNDEDGVTKRYEIKSVPGQTPWRWLRGSYNVLARLHTKFIQAVALYWSDTFHGTDGTLLGDHTPDTGEGGYGGTGDIVLTGNRIHAEDATAFGYFAPDKIFTTSRILFSINTPAEALDGHLVEMGLGVRCDSTGAGRRDGYYCTVRVGYTGSQQRTHQLRIVRHRATANTTVAVMDIPDQLELGTVYQLKVSNFLNRVVLTLNDVTGDTDLASTGIESTLLNNFTGQAVVFEHTVPDPTTPWMSDLSVEAS